MNNQGLSGYSPETAALQHIFFHISITKAQASPEAHFELRFLSVSAVTFKDVISPDRSHCIIIILC